MRRPARLKAERSRAFSWSAIVSCAALVPPLRLGVEKSSVLDIYLGAVFNWASLSGNQERPDARVHATMRGQRRGLAFSRFKDKARSLVERQKSPPAPIQNLRVITDHIQKYFGLNFFTLHEEKSTVVHIDVHVVLPSPIGGVEPSCYGRCYEVYEIYCMRVQPRKRDCRGKVVWPGVGIPSSADFL